MMTDDSATRYPIGTRILSAQTPDHDHDYNGETIQGWDHRRHGGGLMTDQGDVWGIPTGTKGKPSPLLLCLLVFVIVTAAGLALRDTARTADVQKAAGQTVGYVNTPPLLSSSSEDAIAGYSDYATPVERKPLSLSGGTDQIPLDEILTGVRTEPVPVATPVKESH